MNATYVVFPAHGKVEVREEQVREEDLGPMEDAPAAYDGLMNRRDLYTGVVIQWS